MSKNNQEVKRKKEKFKEPALLLVILVVAFIIRLIYLWGQYQYNPMFKIPLMDSFVHHEWALKIASGEGMSPQPYFRAPFYYYLLAFIYKLFGPSIELARLIQCLMGSISCYLIGLIGYRLQGFWTGMLAGMISAFYWPFIYFDAELLSPVLEVFLNLLLLWTLFQAEARRSWILFTVSGLFLGLSAITRPNVLVFLPGIFVWLLATNVKSKKKAWVFCMTALVIIGAALPILQVSLRNYLVGGEFILISSNGGVNFYIGNNSLANGIRAVVPGTRTTWKGGYEDTHNIPEMELGKKLKESEISDYWYKKSFQWIRSDPGQWFYLMIRKFFLFWKTTELANNKPIYFFAQFAPISAIFWVGFPLVATLGLAALIFLRQRWDRWFLCLSFMVLYMCSVIAFFCPARYRLPVIPILILLTSMGIACTIDEVRLRRFKRPLLYLILCAAIATALYLNPLRHNYPVSQQEASGHRILGNMLVLQDKFDGAIKQFNQSLQFDPHSELTYYYLASCLSKQGKTDEAIDKFQEALRINPSHLRAHFDLGKCLMREGKIEESIMHYHKALQINPAYIEVYNNLAIAYLKQGQVKEAINAYRKILKINPDHVDAHSNLGGVYLNQGMLDEAILEFEQVVSIKPNSAQVHNSLGVAYGMKGRLDDAIAEFEQALTIKLNYAEAHYNLAYGYLRKGLNSSLAADHFYKAGLFHLEQGNIDYALAAYRDLKQTGSEELARKLYNKLSPELEQKKGGTEE